MVVRALAPEKEGGTSMKSLGLYRQMEDIYRLRDEINREQWIAESRKWRERAELEIESYLRLRYVVRKTTVH
jgi:hypothetical protein